MNLQLKGNALSLFHSCQELIFPSYCLECGQRLPCRHTPLLCGDCLPGIRFIASPKCPCCGIPFAAGREDHLCGLCLQKTFRFDKARVAVHYRPPVTSIISALKFGGNLTGLATLSHLARISPGIGELTKPDLILPVPLHIKRLRERQFNQALVIAKACFKEFRDRINPVILFRQRETVPQTTLDGTERRQNLAGAFAIGDKDKVKGKNILLIDDVFTTGSTVNECAKVLRKAGAKRIEVFTLARAI